MPIFSIKGGVYGLDKHIKIMCIFWGQPDKSGLYVRVEYNPQNVEV